MKPRKILKNRIKPIKSWSQEFTRIINGRLVISWREWREPQKLWFSTVPEGCEQSVSNR